VTEDLERIGGAIARGAAFLRESEPDQAVLISLQYLQRRYPQAPPLTSDRMRPRPDGLFARLVGRGLQGDSLVTERLSTVQGTDAFVARALYCDIEPLPPQYRDMLESAVLNGGYELTHVSLALKLARDNHCRIPGERQVREHAVEGMRAFIRNPPPELAHERDVRYEAMAFVQDFENEGLDSEVVARLLREQQADGGWTPAAGCPSHPHSTMVAVWALLACSWPQVAEVPFGSQ
jgi:hypothetical protein